MLKGVRMMKSKLKNFLPRKTTITKSIIIIFILGIVSTYLTSALYNQQRVMPDNPLQEEITDYSEVPLFGGLLDLTYADERVDESPKIDEDKEKEENDDKEDKDKKDREKEQVNKSSSAENNDEKEEKENEGNQENQSGTYEQSVGSGNNSDSAESSTDHEDDEATTDENEESPHTEILEPEAVETEEINDYFVTSIENGEVTTKSNYTFNIKQLEHDYTLEDVDVTLDTEGGKVEDVSQDYSEPVIVNLNLAKGENEITVAVTYKDDANSTFTVLRNYTVIYDEEKIVIETNLKDQDVTEEELEFIASAKQGNEQIPLTVHLQQGNEQTEVQETNKNQYIITLQEGTNELTLLATAGDKQAEQSFIINYVKPSPPDLKIETSLVDYHDKTVKEEQLEFTAKGYDGKEAVNVAVSHNGSSTEGENHTYHVTLTEGKNTFEIQAEKDSYSHSESYTVYYEPEATGGEDDDEANERAPEITVHDIIDGETIKNSIRTFHVKVKDYKGNSITQSGKISATNNGEQIARDHTDSQQISFTLSIHNGSNHIIINAEDAEGNKATKELTIQGEVNEDGASIGTATISVEATTVGLGYLIPPQEVEIYQGESSSYVLDRLLKDHGFDYLHTGNLDNSMYFAALQKPGIASNITIPEDLVATLEEHNVVVDVTSYHPDVLGEFDFTGQSGWMYSANGIYANVGFADYYLKEGDVIRIRYTIAYGNDIGLGLNNFHKEW